MKSVRVGTVLSLCTEWLANCHIIGLVHIMKYWVKIAMITSDILLL